RIVTIEDTAELSLPLKHIIRMEARPPGLEGTGEITLDVLTKNSLRMRPDRVIVGEVRHDEAFTLFTAMNTGHDGMACPDSLIQLADGSIKEIGVFCEDYFKKNEVKRFNGIAMTEIKQQKPEIISINKENLSQQTAKVNAIWKRECKESFILKMSSGREIKLSYDHPVFRLKNGFLGQVQSHECETGDYLCVSNEIKIEGKKFSEDYAYFLGLLLGDGHLRKGRVAFENKNKKLHDLFSSSAKKLFGKDAKVYRRSDGRMSSCINSIETAEKIRNDFSIPFGNKTKIFDIPEKIEKADDNALAAFLRGMFDSDGHASNIRACVVLATSNQKVAKKTPSLLKRFGIESRTNIQEKDGRNNLGPYYRIFITGESNLTKFLKHVSFKHPKKFKILNQIVGKKENTNIDIIPNVGALIKNIRENAGLTQKQLSIKAKLGKTRSSINAYETNARNPSRSVLKKINKTLTKEFNKRIRELNKLDLQKTLEKIKDSSSEKAVKAAFAFAKKFYNAEKLQKESGLGNKMLYHYIHKQKELDEVKRKKLSETVKKLCADKTKEMLGTRQLITHINSIVSERVRWEKIKKIEHKQEKTEYYDLTLDKFNTFVANGIVISNCLGTIHANSPQETLVRVTSPPMNVPEVMLSGLDLIIVEHRIHDKKKGTIRRITEIAEVTGVLENKTSTQTLFERDAVTDKLIKTKTQSEYIKTLMKFTGFTAKQIETELNEREQVLGKLIKGNVHEMEDVVNAMHEYLGKK
ncbi:Flp pilus assembly complex ATPase component TadA, partial [Candidatus Micrarchaeota archaeon]|nr:Flp pilus assembly complex ATPase component TadA [Candidatus Micrarchaeota archaeon]